MLFLHIQKHLLFLQKSPINLSSNIGINYLILATAGLALRKMLLEDSEIRYVIPVKSFFKPSTNFCSNLSNR